MKRVRAWCVLFLVAAWPVRDAVAAEYRCADVACLIASITAANAAPDADTIVLAPGLYTLRTEVTIGDGLPIVTSDITIRGGTATMIWRDPPDCTRPNNRPEFRLLHVRGQGARLTLENLTLAGGCTRHTGGAILIEDGARVGLYGVQVTRNTADSGGGIGALGFGIIESNNSTFLYNVAGSGGKLGGAVFMDRGLATFNLTTVRENAAERGGGMAFRNAVVNFSGTVEGNFASTNGGGMFIANRSYVTIARARIQRNGAIRGAGLHVESLSALDVSFSTILGNTGGTAGGGIFISQPAPSPRSLIRSSTVAGNGAERGGGIFIEDNEARLFQVINTTVASNDSNFGGGVFADKAADVLLLNATLHDNVAALFDHAGQGAQVAAFDRARVSVRNSIVTRRRLILARSCFTQFPGFTPGVVSLGHNLDEDGSCAFAAAGDLALVLPGLLPGVDTGAPGGGHFPLGIGSPAVNAGDAAYCAASPELKRDQLEKLRDAQCDMGAVEFRLVLTGKP